MLVDAIDGMDRDWVDACQHTLRVFDTIIAPQMAKMNAATWAFRSACKTPREEIDGNDHSSPRHVLQPYPIA